jgi:hypothetical protein
VLSEALAMIGAGGDWDAGVAWTLDQRARRYECAATWRGQVEPSDRVEQLAQAANRGVRDSAPAEAVAAGVPTWFTDLAGHSDEYLAALAAEGIATAVALPLRVGASPIGAIELYARSPIWVDEELSTVLLAISTDLAYALQTVSLPDAQRRRGWRRY